LNGILVTLSVNNLVSEWFVICRESRCHAFSFQVF
jgi:hypothetical protein